MKHKFLKFLPSDTMSRVFNDGRDTVGRLSTLILLLFALSFGFSSQAWAGDNCDFLHKESDDVWIKYTKNGGSETQQNIASNGQSDIDLEAVTSLKLTQFRAITKKHDGNVCSVKLHYGINSSRNGSKDETLSAGYNNDGYSDWTWDNWWSCQQFKNASVNLDILDGLTPGIYYFDFYFDIEGNSGSSSGCYASQKYWNNNGGDYHIKFTVNPIVTFNANGGTGSDYTQTVTYNTSTKLNSNSFTAPTGYTFNGWNTKADGSGTKYSNGGNITTTVNVTLYAQWTAKTYNLTIVGNYPGSDYSYARTVTYGNASFTVTQENRPTRTGYTLQGYYKEAACTEAIAGIGGALKKSTSYTDADGKWSYDATSTVTLYAGWKANTTSITLDKQEGTGGKSAVTATYDAAMPDAGAIPAKTGYDFAGYFDGQNGTGNKYYNADCSSAHVWDKDATTATLYAYWVPKTYTVTLSQTHATTQGTTSVTATYNAVLPAIETLPQRTGYTFGGYNTNTSLLLVNAQGEWQKSVTGFTDAEGKWTKTDNATLSPIWNPITTTVTLKANGGTGDDQTFTATFDVVVDASTKTPHTRTGYDLKGYYNATSGGNQILNADLTVRTNAVTGWLSADGKWKNPNTTADLFAQWTAHTWTITLNDNEGTGGSGTKTATYGSSSNITKVTIPTRDNYSFAGYYSDQAGEEVQVYDVNGNLLANATGYTDADRNWIYDNNVTLYAKWNSVGNYVITLDNLSATTAGTTSVNVQINTTTGLTTNITCPTKTGYTFGGYFTETGGSGIKLINADGSWVKPAEGYIDSDGKWIKNENVTLKAKWDANKTTVTFDNQGATTAGTGQRTLTYKSTDFGSAFESPAKTGYTFGGYFTETNGGGTQLISAEGAWIADVAGYTETSEDKIKWIKTTTDPLTLYAKWTEKMTTVTLSAGVGGSIDPTANQSVGVATTVQVTATPAAGYSFDAATGWAVTGNAVKTDANPTTLSGNGEGGEGTLTATFTAITYTITYNLDGGTNYDGAPATYTIETTTINLGTPTKTDYTFDGWYDAETGGNQVTQIALGSTGNKTLWARWHETLHYVNLVARTGITTISPKEGATDVGNVTPVQIEATVAEGYTWKNWTTDNSSHVTITDANANPTTIKATGSTNVYANATENMTTITINANQTTWGKLQIGSTEQQWGSTREAGVATNRDLTARPNTGYKFVNWTLTGGATLYSGELTDQHIKVKGDGSSATGTATAIFEEDLSSNWYLAGTSPMFPNGWNTGETNMMLRATGHSTENVYYFTIHVNDADIKPAGQESTYQFKIRHYKKNECDDYFGWSTDNTHYWVDKTCSTGVYKGTGNDNNLYFIPTIAGDYKFKVDATGANPELTVTFPAAQTYTVTISADANGTVEPSGEQQVDAFNGISVTATPNAGYHFAGWVKSDGITTTSETATTTVKASKAGTLQATFAANTPIYFQNAIKNTWNPEHLYIYLYKDNTYWEGTGDDKQDRGTGSQEGKYKGSCIAGPFEMTHIQNTDIWEYDYDPALSFNTIVFTEQEMTNYEWFANCTAVRRTDFNSCMNMFVLNDATEEWHNNTARYFNNGFWRNYNSTTSKMYLHIWDVTATKELNDGAGYEMTTSLAGNETFNAKVNLSGSHQYNIYLGACNSKNFSKNVTITSENCSGIQMYQYNSIDNKAQLAYLHTAASGDYTFSLTFADDKMLLSVEYPITSNDYRVKIGSPVRYSNIIRAAEESGTISMFLNVGTNTFTYEKATNVDVSPIVWSEDGTINVNVEKAGVYTMTLSRDKNITNVEPYTGNYYIRTDCAQGGWNEYKTNDNNLMQFTDRNPKFVNNPTDGFNYYYCRWNANASGNVRFVVANDINACISDTMKADTWLDNGEALKGMANIRFGWNSNTNDLSRAYISGSFDSDEYIRILSSDGKIFEYTQEETKPVITAKKFVDENDWTYTMDVYADGGSQIAVSAKYNNKYQFFVGTGEASTGTVATTEQLLQGGTKQHLRLIYDFKTDRLVSGWMPSDTITNDVILNADMLLARVGQGNADQINIETAGIGIKEIKTIYAVLQLDRDTMLNETTGINAKGYRYKNAIYWFSLPFDVKVNDIFGVDGYGTKWVLQYYDGAKRAKIGFFQETETFWTYLGINDTIKANIGYALCLDPDYFNSAEDAIWANNRQSVCFYFPSLDKNLHIVESKDTITTHVPQHECTIDRWFGKPDDTHPQGTKNHKITDTDWNVIGSPAFQNLTGTANMGGFQSLYEWQPSNNTYQVASVNGFTFKSTSAYLVQFHGDIKWQAASVINPTVAAPRYAYADEKNYTVELQFHYGSQWDRTYVALKDNANEDFVLNEDLTKMINAGQPNIYSYAGAYDVAYNGTTLKDQIVTLGVIAPKNGTYTFSMPKDFSGTAQLYDMEEGTITDLNVSNYSVDLNKGTYNNRFQLMLKVEASTPTNIDNVDSREWSVDGKTKKLLINDQIYLINGGRVYNATGAELR